MGALRIIPRFEGVEGVTLYQVLGRDGRPVPGPRAAVVGLVHGNEVVGGHVLDALPAHLGTLRRGEVLAVRANTRAAARGLRHTPEGRDLNRIWDPRALATLQERGPASFEEQRALELAPLLGSCQAILDLHSTTRPSPAFLIFRDDQHHALVARELGVELLVTGLFERRILDGGMCPDVGLAWGESSQRLGFTLEAGQHTDPANLHRALVVVLRYLAAQGLWEGELPPLQARPRVFEVTDRHRQAPAGTAPWRFVGHQGGEPGGGRRGPRRLLASFEEVQADEVLMRRGASAVQRPQAPFTILLPTPAAPPGEDLYYVARRRRGGVAEGEAPRTDAQARREALAVERFLDQMDVDAFERGTSWASFDPRHVLDLCAALVTRALRLPPGHPHRRISVVGRGDHGGDESERRAGRRYRSAMRQALAEGIPVDRVQILRGSTMGWLDALTGQGMSALLQARQQGANPPPDSLRLFLSAKQPHTLSLLVVGDLERALQEGRSRHVRVAVLVEAATVEPDQGRASVRIVRGGLVSSRPEILAAAHQLLQGLRQEHALLLDLPPLSDLPILPELMDEDGGLVLPRDPQAREQLGLAIRALLLELWSPSLERVLSPRTLGEPAQVGQWLAEVMGATGVLDGEALAATCLAPTPRGWEVRPEGPAQSLARPLGLRLPSRPRSTMPEPPLLAEDVDADGLQRWLSWKRYLHDGLVIPDTRGKDLDLALAEGDIRRRVARWMREALAEGMAHPGTLLVLVAGDGLRAERDSDEGARELLGAHDRLLFDPSVRYIRIQHLKGAWLGWIKHLLALHDRRADRGEPASVLWEDEHGASLNLILVARREGAGAVDPWSLDGWRVERCGVVLSDLVAPSTQDYALGLFTEPGPGGEPASVHQELAAFGRAHAQALLGHARWHGGGGEGLREQVLERMTHWVVAARDGRGALTPPPEDLDERALWVADWIGLADMGVARDIAGAVLSQEPARQVAERIWEETPSWPHQVPRAV